MKDLKCEDCYYYSNTVRRCIRNAPQLDTKSTWGVALWPYTQFDDWCGEWRCKKCCETTIVNNDTDHFRMHKNERCRAVLLEELEEINKYEEQQKVEYEKKSFFQKIKAKFKGE